MCMAVSWGGIVVAPRMAWTLTKQLSLITQYDSDFGFGGGAKPYPLKTCIVTGNDLNSMGDEQSIVHEG